MLGMESPRKIVQTWGRQTLASDLDIPEERVRAWERFNSIPAGYWEEMLNKAPGRDIDISPEILIRLAARN